MLRTWFVEILDDDRSRLMLSPGAMLEFVADGGTAAAVDPGWDLGLKRLADALDL